MQLSVLIIICKMLFRIFLENNLLRIKIEKTKLEFGFILFLC